MAVVTSYTADRILQFMSAFPSLQQGLEQLQAKLEEVRITAEGAAATVVEFNGVTLPPLQEALDANEISLADLRDNVIPGLELSMGQNQLLLDHLNEFVIPALQQDLDSGIENSLTRPRIIFSATEPENPDEDDRYLEIDDVWYDTDDGYRRYRWTGLAWETFEPAISDLAEQIRDNLSPEHTIYGDKGGVETTIGSGITAV